MRFSPKLRLAFLLPALAAVLTVLPLLWVFATRIIESSAKSHLQSTLPVLAPLVTPRLHAAPGELQAWVEELSGRQTLRVTVIRSDGVVLADSSRTWDEVRQMDNHANRPEVEAAFSSGTGTSLRYSATLGEGFVYAAQQVRDPEGKLLILRLSQPVAALKMLKHRLVRVLLVGGLVAFLVVALVSWWLDRQLFQPLSILVRDANRMAGGEFGHRLVVPEEDELADLARSLNRLGERVEEQMAAVESERRHLEVVGASMSEGILVTDAEGRALLVNPAFRRLFRVRGPVAGKTLLELTRQPALDDLLRVTLERGEYRETDLELAVPHRRPVAVSLTALSDRSGVVLAARDLTDLVRLGEVRRDLVANVAHELKTPLAAIRGYAETLADGALEDENHAGRFVARILEQCHRLQLLLDDLLTLSSLERRDEPRERRPVDLAELVEEAAGMLEIGAGEREVEVTLDLDSVPAIDGEPATLEKLCLNLIDNAIKYNRPGGVVDVRLRRRAKELVLEVEDTGPGIPASALPRLFERFYRVDSGRSREEGGTGLGLAIAKHAAQRHAGRIEVTSEPGEGSIFRVFLPLAAPALRAAG